ncbi:4-hydroxyphenylacetate decarboxylase small subunit, partial [Anaerospora sp.]
AFRQAEKCGNCKNFLNPDKYGIGTCTGLEKENWAYATCGAFACRGYQAC